MNSFLMNSLLLVVIFAVVGLLFTLISDVFIAYEEAKGNGSDASRLRAGQGGWWFSFFGGNGDGESSGGDGGGGGGD